MPEPEMTEGLFAEDRDSSSAQSEPAAESRSSIIDNRGGNTLVLRLQQMTKAGQELWIATAFFSLDALGLLSDTLAQYSRVRILFGSDASATQRKKLLDALRIASDKDLLERRSHDPTLSCLRKAAALFEEGRVEARCYTQRKFHAKAYLIQRPEVYPPELAVIGSGNFTRPGLTQNVELNVELTTEQTAQLRAWYEERWQEAERDVVTADVLGEIRRQIELYDPYVIYLKALLLWGSQLEWPVTTPETSAILGVLDPHQEHGVRRALRLIEQNRGCMICDGVGLGKSYIALALMERFCREGRNVLLIAPRNILDATWQPYLDQYLAEYVDGWGGVKRIAMTDLGFRPEDKDKEEGAPSDTLIKKRKELQRLLRGAGVVIIDESHNFRTSSANRYVNLEAMLKTAVGPGKSVVLLTATPINTAYRDIANQLALITQDSGYIAGYSKRTIYALAAHLDADSPPDPIWAQSASPVYESPDETLNRILEAVVIQRSRRTVKSLADAVGKEVHFPKRNDPRAIEISLANSPEYRHLITLTERRFRATAGYIKDLREAQRKAGKNANGAAVTLPKPKGPPGLKLAAFLIEQYRRQPELGSREFHYEVSLAGLILVQTLKQLESSPVAFQGILQSLAEGLLARLSFVFGDEAESIVRQHEEWIKAPLFPAESSTPRGKPNEGEGLEDSETTVESDEEEDLDALEASGEAADASGEETDQWLARAIATRGLVKKLRNFREPDYDTARWRDDILRDLDILREIHAATQAARGKPDPKLEQVLPVMQQVLDSGRKLLIFTQSRRTAVYLARELRKRLAGHKLARMDSTVSETRAAILYAFCPNYNPRPDRWPESVPASLDVLISTDVLSEGVNLQDAGAILSYDIHWNPVRLIQRIGRVDRRIDPALTPPDHYFDILNVLPPEEIDGIINLVGAVEGRTVMISKALGLDVSFFKSTDPAGNLKEFNALADGEDPPLELAYREYARAEKRPPDPEAKALAEALPPGAFSVWGGAPENGLFALFTLQPTKDLSDDDARRFNSLIGKAVLALEREGGRCTANAGLVLRILAGTTPGERSALPSDEKTLPERLRELRDWVRGQFSDVGEHGLPVTIVPRLECWMELRRNA